MTKLLYIERSIGIYGSLSEKLLKEIPIDITIEEIELFVTREEGDLEFYAFYILSEAQLEGLKKYCSEDFEVDFNKSFYVLSCLGIYDYEVKDDNPTCRL